jgi:hypothetical protein
MKFMILSLFFAGLAFAGYASADAWTYFYPEAVTSLSCTTRPVQLQAAGAKESQSVWEAEAHAERNDKSLGSWSMTVGVFPQNLKGRHAAEKSCSKWMDEASKRVKAVAK